MPNRSRFATFGLRYYAPTESGHGFHGFNIDTCEVCGCKVLASNSVTLMETEKKLIRLGMKKTDYPRDDLGYCEKLEKHTCSGCHEEL